MSGNRLKRFLVLSVIFCLLASYTPFSFAKENLSHRTIIANAGGGITEDQKAIEKAKVAIEPFKEKETAPIIPYGTGENEYTNALEFIKDTLKKATGRDDVKLSYSVAFAGTTTYKDYADSEGTEVKMEAMDTTTFDIKPVKGDEPSYPMVFGFTIQYGAEKYEAGLIRVGVEPEKATDDDILNFEGRQLNFLRIKAKNKSNDYITGKVGESTSYKVDPLPTKCLVYKNKYAIKWKYKILEGSDKAFSMDSKYNTTVTRPDPLEEDTKILLEGTVYKKDDENIKKTVQIPLTIPAYKPIKVPLTISPTDAKLSIKLKGKEIDSKFIKNKGDGKYDLILHGSPTDTANTYVYNVSKNGFITENGDIRVEPNEEANPVNINLDKAGEHDSDLKVLSVTQPSKGSKIIKTPPENFATNKEKYTMTVSSGLKSIDLHLESEKNKASITVTKLNYSGKKSTKKITGSGDVTCYLNEFTEETKGKTTIDIEVTAPDGSEATKKTYSLEVIKVEENLAPLEKISISGLDDEENPVEPASLSGSGFQEEEQVYPTVLTAGIEDEYFCEVSNACKKIKLSLVSRFDNPYEIESVKVNDTELGISEYADIDDIVLPLNDSGTTKLTINVTDTLGTHVYNLNVIKKPHIEFKNIEVGDEKFDKEEVMSKDSSGIGYVTFPHNLKDLRCKFNMDSDQYIIRSDDKDKKINSGEEFDFHQGPNVLYIVKQIGDKSYADKFVISFTRGAANSPDNTDSYLPAPGQFVNQKSYMDPSKTINKPAGNMVTLGGFGGNIVYYFKDPIKDDPKNPFGIDFILFGNCFTEPDGTSAVGAMEPASVMVSEDGKSWYELAGSEYYNLNTSRNVTIQYTNPDTNFTSAKDIPYTIIGIGNGILKANSYHGQPYFPNPKNYDQYQKGVSKNPTYSKDSVTFKGTLIDRTEVSFGYADTHAFSNSGDAGIAANPYRKGHLANSNGDGMDLAWAVDENGLPVELKNGIHYVKVYTSVQADRGSIGEVSSEIAGMLISKPDSDDVGTSEGLKSLTINNEAIELNNSILEYKGDTSNGISVKAMSKEGSNVYVNGIWNDGKTEVKLAPGNIVRIIVQEGNKAPKIYHVKIKNTVTKEKNVNLDKLSLIPGNKSVKGTEAQDNTLIFDVDSDVDVISFNGQGINKNAKLSIKKNSSNNAEVKSTGFGERFAIGDGENDFTLTITSEDGTESKAYNVKVNRKALDESKKISVKFKLRGDANHGETSNGHKSLDWISERSLKIPKGSKVSDLIMMALYNNEIDCEGDLSYLSGVNGLKAFDNGKNSGWMYKLNGKIPSMGIDQQTLNDKDSVELFYTDDYRREQGYGEELDLKNLKEVSIEDLSALAASMNLKGDKKASADELLKEAKGKINDAKKTEDVEKLVKDYTKRLKAIAHKQEEENEPSQENEYTITVDPNGGNWNGDTASKTQKVKNNAKFKLPEAPKKEGYTFLYWKGSKYQPGQEYTVKGDHTFIAQWKKNEKTSEHNTKNINKSPTTGDSTRLMLYTGISLAVLIILFVVLKRRKNYK